MLKAEKAAKRRRYQKRRHAEMKRKGKGKLGMYITHEERRKIKALLNLWRADERE